MKIISSWRFWITLVSIVLGTLYALPNLYGYKPALQINDLKEFNASLDENAIRRVLDTNQIEYSSIINNQNTVLVQFADITNQLAAQRAINTEMDSVITSIRLEPQHPKWLNDLNALPMYLGLDLRGGVYFLMEVDINSALNDLLNRYMNDFDRGLKAQNIPSQTTLDTSNQKVDLL